MQLPSGCPSLQPHVALGTSFLRTGRAEVLNHVTNGVGGALYSEKGTALRIAASPIRFRMKGWRTSVSFDQPCARHRDWLWVGKMAQQVTNQM